jgi:hypothetical protein
MDATNGWRARFNLMSSRFREAKTGTREHRA